MAIFAYRSVYYLFYGITFLIHIGNARGFKAALTSRILHLLAILIVTILWCFMAALISRKKAICLLFFLLFVYGVAWLPKFIIHKIGLLFFLLFNLCCCMAALISRIPMLRLLLMALAALSMTRLPDGSEALSKFITFT